MNGIRAIAAALIVGGVLALGYGGFSYTKDTTAVKVGPVELNVKQTERINIPLWAGLAALAAGAALAIGSARRR